jgi:Ca2+-binding RTX toxin-like protein
MRGPPSSDYLEGGTDDDLIKGGPGDDFLAGGAGVDVLEGGELGHVLGQQHQTQGVMQPNLQPGERTSLLPNDYRGDTPAKPGNGNGTGSKETS